MIKRRASLHLILKVTLPAIVFGLLILPNFAVTLLSVHIPPKPKLSKPLEYRGTPVLSKVLTVQPNERVEIRLPPEKSNETDLIAIVIELPRREEIVVNVTKLDVYIIPNEEYDILSWLDISFVDAKTGKVVEPSGYIYFKIPKEFMKSRNYDPENAVMLKYHNEWYELKTKLTGEDSKNYYYVAETKSFSIFAIAVKRVVPENCTKCHKNVAIELSLSPYHNFNCTFCHPGMSRNVTCVQCHPDIGEFAAHKKFIEWAENNSLMVGSNEACIACHTYAKIPIYNVTERTYLSFSSDLRKIHEQ